MMGMICFVMSRLLIFQRTSTVGENDAGYGLQQDAIFGRHLVDGAHENAAWLVGRVGAHAGGDEALDLILEQLAIAAGVFVENDQVGGQSFEVPIGLGLDELFHQRDVGAVGHVKQHDR